MPQQKYIFHDVTGTCFTDYAKLDDYARNVATLYLIPQRPLGVGDMLAFRDDLLDAGYTWGTDFFVTKITPQP